MIRPFPANTAVVSRAPTSRISAVSGKSGFSIRRTARGTASMSITAVSRTYSARSAVRSATSARGAIAVKISASAARPVTV